MVQNEEDISPYATFHLLGMREENKNGGNPNPQNQFKTLQPNQSGPGTMMGGPPPGMVQQTGPMGGTQTGPNTPAHQRQIQTMNVSIYNTYLIQVLKFKKYNLFIPPSFRLPINTFETLMCGSCHIQNVLIGVEYRNCP